MNSRAYFLLLLFFFSCSIFLQSQKLDWKWSQFFSGNHNEQNELPKGLFIDSLNNTYIVGEYYEELTIGDTVILPPDLYEVRSPFVSKFSPSGEFQWVNNQGLSDQYSEIHVDKAGAIHVLGRTPSSFEPNLLDTTITQDNGRLFYAKYDKDWNLSFCHQIPSGLNPVSQAIVTDSDGNGIVLMVNRDSIILKGDTLRTGHDDPFYQYYLIKYNREGEVLWHQNISYAKSDHSFQLTVDSQNNIILSGDFSLGMNTDEVWLSTNGFGLRDIYVLKFSPSGDLVWHKHFEGSSVEYCNDVFIDQYDNIFLTGTIAAGAGSFDELEYDLGLGAYQPFFAKINPTGIVDFLVLEPMNSNFAAGRNIAVNEAGNIFLAGQFSAFNAQIGDTMISTATVRIDDVKLFVAQYDSLANFCGVITSAGTCVDRPVKLVLNQTGQLFLTGRFGCNITLGADEFSQVGDMVSNTDIFFSEISYENSDCAIISDTRTFQPLETEVIQIFPNPAKVAITVTCDQVFKKPTLPFIIRNQTGQIVLSGNLNIGQESTEINIEHLSKGVYFFQLVSSSIPNVKKFVIMP